MSSVVVSPPESVTVRRKVYVPAMRVEMTVVGEVGVLMVNVAGPAIFVHAYVTDPSASLPEPAIVTLDVGSVMDWSGPAFALGAVFPPHDALHSYVLRISQPGWSSVQR
jgi:hypothetical protein